MLIYEAVSSTGKSQLIKLEKLSTTQISQVNKHTHTHKQLNITMNKKLD
jgi:hypothetical protein